MPNNAFGIGMCHWTCPRLRDATPRQFRVLLRRTACASFAIVLLGMDVNACSAQNPAFLPGDAFFHAILDENLAKAFSGSEPVKVRYVRPRHVRFSFNGTSGYRVLRLDRVPESTRQGVLEVYRFLRTRIPKLVQSRYDPVADEWDEQELNGFDFFVYNRDFDLQSHRIGIKYNETWGAEIAKFGYTRHNAEVESFGRDWDDWVAEIRDADAIRGLASDLPAAPPRKSKAVEEPMTINGGVKFIVVPRNLRRCMRERDGCVVFEIDSEGWRAIKRTRTRWKTMTPDELESWSS